MNAKKKHLMTVLLVAGFLFVGLVVTDGCKKSEPAPSETAADTMHSHEGDEHEGHEHAAMSSEPAKAVVAAAEQTTCPIMVGNAIKKTLFTEYQGKKVYFCCPGCKPEFEKNPEKYIAKLPQFQQ
ncbi:MAG: YHS domain-containing protein [Planctomycetota bacterium]